MLNTLLMSTVLALPPSIPDMTPVGSAELKVMFWSIYEAQLKSTDGSYDEGEYPLLLSINYRRNIPQKKLVNATADEWERLGICQDAPCYSWINDLGQIWPDIEKGDQLQLLALSADQGHFFHNGEYIASFDGAQFSDSFLSIWLSEESRYPEHRQKLIGKN